MRQIESHGNSSLQIQDGAFVKSTFGGFGFKENKIVHNKYIEYNETRVFINFSTGNRP